MSGRTDLGIAGEAIAKDYLISKDYTILDERWRYNKAEVDLICKEGEILVFVEVKTRSTDFFGAPEEFISDQKKRLMSIAASAYMQKTNHDWEIRFDVISVIMNSGRDCDIQHFKDAFFLGI